MKNRLLPFFVCILLCCSSCGAGGNADSADDEEVIAQTPVQVTTITHAPMQEYIELNATSSYMQKSILKANISGYIQAETAQKGKYVRSGQTLFSLITKEARAIGNTITSLDPSFKFSGISAIKAMQSGYISEMSHQQGDYVQEGEQLAVISNTGSFVFLMDVPYELNGLMRSREQVTVTLPDGKALDGYITTSLPAVDSLSQTQRFAIHVNSAAAIPEGLIGKVKILKTARPAAFSFPKSAILTNETEDTFWVMKLINDTTAVKVTIKKGIETGDKVEVLSPAFSATDRVITVGNYGLADTAKVKITGN